MKKLVTFDATGKKLGRLASDIAMALQGKNEPSYERHVLENIEVRVTNASKMDLADRLDRGYKSYSGYPGGLRIEKAGRLQERKGTAALLKHAVSGMLPKNTHRSRLLLCLVVEE